MVFYHMDMPCLFTFFFSITNDARTTSLCLNPGACLIISIENFYTCNHWVMFLRLVMGFARAWFLFWRRISSRLQAKCLSCKAPLKPFDQINPWFCGFGASEALGLLAGYWMDYEASCLLLSSSIVLQWHLCWAAGTRERKRADSSSWLWASIGATVDGNSLI